MTAIIGFLGAIGAIFLFIAVIATWVNTGKTAHYAELLWRVLCEDEERDPKTGRKLPTARPLNG